MVGGASVLGLLPTRLPGPPREVLPTSPAPGAPCSGPVSGRSSLLRVPRLRGTVWQRGFWAEQPTLRFIAVDCVDLSSFCHSLVWLGEHGGADNMGGMGGVHSSGRIDWSGGGGGSAVERCMFVNCVFQRIGCALAGQRFCEHLLIATPFSPHVISRATP